MSERRSALHRWLPPVLVLAVLGAVLAVALRTRGAARAREEAVLRAEVALPDRRTAAGADVEAYLQRYGTDPEARWFAIEMHATRLDLRSAFAAFDADPAFRDAPGAARRLAATLLRHLGDRPSDGAPSSWLFSRALLARLDAGDPDAPRALEDLVKAMAPRDIVNLYGPAHRSRTRGADAMADALLRRGSEAEFRGAAWALRAQPDRPQAGDAMRPLLESAWRNERPFFWSHIARAVGQVGSPADQEALRREHDLATGDSLDDRRRRLATSVGLAVAGDPDARARVRRALSDSGNDWAGVLLAIGLHARMVGGDPSAADRLIELAGSGVPPTTRLQIAMSVMLSDAEPEGLPVDRWAADLEQEPTRIARTLAHAWALRRRAPGAVAALLADLRSVLAAKDVVAETTGLDDDDGSATVEALRALARWG